MSETDFETTEGVDGETDWQDTERSSHAAAQDRIGFSFSGELVLGEYGEVVDYKFGGTSMVEQHSANLDTENAPDIASLDKILALYQEVKTNGWAQRKTPDVEDASRLIVHTYELAGDGLTVFIFTTYEHVNIPRESSPPLKVEEPEEKSEDAGENVEDDDAKVDFFAANPFWSFELPASPDATVEAAADKKIEEKNTVGEVNKVHGVREAQVQTREINSEREKEAVRVEAERAVKTEAEPDTKIEVAKVEAKTLAQEARTQEAQKQEAAPQAVAAVAEKLHGAPESGTASPVSVTQSRAEISTTPQAVVRVAKESGITLVGLDKFVKPETHKAVAREVAMREAPQQKTPQVEQVRQATAKPQKVLVQKFERISKPIFEKPISEPAPVVPAIVEQRTETITFRAAAANEPRRSPVERPAQVAPTPKMSPARLVHQVAPRHTVDLEQVLAQNGIGPDKPRSVDTRTEVKVATELTSPARINREIPRTPQIVTREVPRERARDHAPRISASVNTGVSFSEATASIYRGAMPQAGQRSETQRALSALQALRGNDRSSTAGSRPQNIENMSLRTSSVVTDTADEQQAQSSTGSATALADTAA